MRERWECLINTGDGVFRGGLMQRGVSHDEELLVHVILEIFAVTHALFDGLVKLGCVFLKDVY